MQKQNYFGNNVHIVFYYRYIRAQKSHEKLSNNSQRNLRRKDKDFWWVSSEQRSWYSPILRSHSIHKTCCSPHWETMARSHGLPTGMQQFLAKVTLCPISTQFVFPKNGQQTEISFLQAERLNLELVASSLSFSWSSHHLWWRCVFQCCIIWRCVTWL